MSLLRHRLRRARFFLGALVAALLIAAAVAMGLMQLLLPLAARYPDRLAALLSSRLHRPVHFTSVQGQWQPAGPLLSVRGLTLGPAWAGGESFNLPKAAIKFDFGAWLKPAHRWITLRATGLDLRVVRDASGWRVLGLSNPNDTREAPLQSLPVDLDLHVVRVRIDDTQAQRSYVLYSPRLRVVSVGRALRFGGSIVREGSPEPITVIGRFDGGNQDVDLYIAGSGLDLAAMTHDVDLQGFGVRSGRGDLELWGSWRGGHLRSAAARFNLTALGLTARGGRHARIPALSGVVDLARIANGWRVRYRGPGDDGADIDAASGLLAQVQDDAGSRRVALAARALDVAPWLSVAALLPQSPATLGDWISAAHPHGKIESAALRWRSPAPGAASDYTLVANITGIGAAPDGKLPGVDMITGTLRADQQAFVFDMPAQPVTLRYPAVFRQPFPLTRLDGTFAAWREGSRWHVAVDDLDFDSPQFGGSARGHLVLPGDGMRPFLDAYAVVTHAGVASAKLFLPNTMPPATVQWLDRGLVAGKVTLGRVLVRGDLDDWPFPDHQGRFEAISHVADTTLDYGDDWPRADKINATASFVDTGLVVEASHAETLGIQTTQAVARIPDFANGILMLGVQGDGRGASLLDFVRKSPVGHNAATTLSSLTLGGSGKFAFSLVLPFAHPQDFSLDGDLDLDNADVASRDWGLQLEGTSGRLHFDARGFRADALSTRYHGVPASLSLAVGGDVADPAHQVEAALSGRFTAQSLLRDYPDLASLAKFAQGSAYFRIGVDIATGGATNTAAKMLTVHSDLNGIALSLPAPLDKPTGEALPLTLTFGMPFAGANLALALGDVLRVRGRLPDAPAGKPAALAIAFGAQPPPTVPASGMLISGHAARFDLSGWAQSALGGDQTAANTPAPSSAAGLPPLARADIQADEATLFDKKLGTLSLHFATQSDAHTLTLDGPLLAGTLTLPTTNLAQRGVTAQLQRLYWPADTAPPASAANPPPDATTGIAPGALPPLHIAVADLHLGDSKLGEVHFESTPDARGMHVTRLDTQSKDVQIHSHGDWDGDAQSSRSQFVIDIAADNLGRMLDAFGFAGLISGGDKTHAHIDASWPGAPSAFALANLDGAMKVSVGKGRILEVRPGVGRLFGLVSIRELPRRLTLDFGDVFKSGFGFNSVSGNFTLKDGNANTDDLDIKGPAAEIRVRGRTGLRAHDYDQIVSVTPHLGGALPVVGAVVGGPVGAAAGLAVQGLLGRGLNKAAGARYHITGSWEKPVITTISKTVPKPAPTQSGSSPSAPASAQPAPSQPASAHPVPTSNPAPPAAASSSAQRSASQPASASSS